MITCQLAKMFVITSYDTSSDMTYFETWNWEGTYLGINYTTGAPNSFNYIYSCMPDGLVGTFDKNLALQWQIPWVEVITGTSVNIYTYDEINSGINTTIIIKGEKGMTGTIELTSSGWLWHIASPVQLDIYYGGGIGDPATWIDKDGNDQMAMIQMGGAGVLQAALDENYSGGSAEKWVNLTDTDIISQNSGYTVQLRYPKSNIMFYPNSNIMLYVGIAVLGLGAVILSRRPSPQSHTMDRLSLSRTNGGTIKK